MFTDKATTHEAAATRPKVVPGGELARRHPIFPKQPDALVAEQRERLDSLVAVPASERQSPLDRLRDGPYVQSGPEISRAVARLAEIRALACGSALKWGPQLM